MQTSPCLLLLLAACVGSLGSRLGDNVEFSDGVEGFKDDTDYNFDFDVDEAQVENLTDDVFAGLKTYCIEENMTTMELPDISQDFSYPMLWIFSLSGSLNLTRGSINGYQDIKRFGNSRLYFFKLTNQLVAQTGIELPKLLITYDFSITAGAVKQHGKILVTVKNVKARGLFSSSTDTLEIALADFKIEKLGSISVKVKDGVVGWLATAVITVVLDFMKSNLKRIIESELPPALNKILKDLDLPSLLKPPADLLGY